MTEWDKIFVAILLLSLFSVLIHVNFTVQNSINEKERADKEWRTTSEHKECLAACRKQGYMTYISAPSNCVCDTTKMVIK